MKSLYDFYVLDDSKWSHAIYESIEEYCLNGEDIDHDGQIDDHDYELYLNYKVEHLDHYLPA